MYTKRNITYADPYKMLQGNGIRAYQAQGKGFTEINCPIDDLRIEGNLAKWGKGNIVMSLEGCDSYEKIKTKLVKIRYSNDDQIAIMLNGDAEDMQRMQAWRDWAGAVAKAIAKAKNIYRPE